ncbi:hypothetical protein [Halospeciosus flavus]|uniref:Polyketide cyclase n=1 Tax=Halospeciosus flavus TaxID=3032283 RepID=A0ABD5Z983_9EURY|nr:hypothetical protein [Halospeciosus flavus]
MSDRHPRYPDVNRRIVERAFPRLREFVRTEGWEEATSDFEHRAPRLTSAHPDHPEAVTYAFKLAPETELNMLDGNVSVKIDVLGDSPAPDTLRRNASRFRTRGFDVETENGRETYEIVWDSWVVDPNDVAAEKTVRAVAERFVTLVKTGHEVLTE